VPGKAQQWNHTTSNEKSQHEKSQQNKKQKTKAVPGKAQQWSHTPLQKSQHEKSQQKIMILTEKIDTREAKVKGSAIGWVSLVWRFQACSGMTSPSLPCVRILLASNARCIADEGL
jgi:hypothetical protein